MASRPNRVPRATSEYTFERLGRCYLISHPDYMFPSDRRESERMNLFHDAVRDARGHSHSAPLNKHSDHLRILDVGTGTGRWAIKMAEKYAQCSEVWGIDVAPWQPERIPPNVKFQWVDIEAPWQGLGSESWDLVHVRCMYGAVTSWPQLYENIWNCLIPGAGYIEHTEIDWQPVIHTTPSGQRKNCTTVEPAPHYPLSVFSFWARSFYDCMDAARRPARVDSAATHAALYHAGFVDIKEDTYLLPYNADDSKERFPRVFDDWIEGLSLRPFLETAGSSFNLAAVDQMLIDARRELAAVPYPVYCTMHVWTGMRPSYSQAGSADTAAASSVFE